MESFGIDARSTAAARYILRSMAAASRCQRRLECGDEPGAQREYALLTQALRQLEGVVSPPRCGAQDPAAERLTSLIDRAEEISQRFSRGPASASA
jgi:hypothetical protein